MMNGRAFRVLLALLVAGLVQPFAGFPEVAKASFTGGYYPVAVRPETDGTFAGPLGIAVDSNGYVYVADTQNHRIKKHSPSGAVLAVWGSFGAQAGRFERPTGVAVGTDGRVYVTDTGNDRVQVLDSSGAPVAQWTAGDTIRSPTGIAIDAAGAVYVSDTGNNRIIKFSSEGAVIAVIGGSGSGNGLFDAPHGVAVDATHLYVADSNNRRIQKFTLAGVYVAQWGPVESGGMTYSRYATPYGVAVAGSDTLLVVDLAGMRNPPMPPAPGPLAHIERCTKSGGSPVQWGAPGTGVGEYRTPGGIAARPGGGAYVADAGNNRVQVLDSTWTTTMMWSGAGSGAGELDGPRAVTEGPDGMTYVADAGNHRVQVFDAGGRFVRQFGGVGVLSSPADLAIDASSTVWVAEEGASRLSRFSLTGDYLGSIGAGQLSAPQGVAIDAAGNIWVADTGGARLRKFSRDGTLLQTIQTFSGGPGAFAAPSDIAVDGSDRLWVVDRDAASVLVFDASGVFVTAFGSFGSGAGQFKQPTGIAIGQAGQVYVSDSGNARMQRFSSAGTHQATFGASGAGLGQLAWPTRPAVLADGTLLVPERDNHRLQLFAYDGTAPHTTASGVPAGWTNQDVTVTLSAVDGGSGVAMTYYRIGAGPTLPYSKPFVINTDFNGTVRFWSVDVVGNVESEKFVTVKIDKTPPSGTFALNGGAKYSASPTVTVGSSVSSGNEMRLDAGLGWGPWGPIWPTQVIALPGEGLREVKAQYRDPAGNILSLSATITVDLGAPLTTATGIFDRWVAEPVSITLEAADDYSGVAETYYRIGDTGKVELYNGPFQVTAEGVTRVWFWSVDGVGNVEEERSVQVWIDLTAPHGTMVLASGASHSSVPQVAIESSVTGATFMRIDAGAGFGPWRPYAPYVTVELPEGYHTVTVEYRDDVDDPYRFVRLSDSIVVDFPPPAPAGLRVRGFGTGWVELDWTPVGAPDVTGYTVWRRAGATGSWIVVRETTHPVATVRDAGLDPDVEYRYRVIARDSVGNVSDASPEVHVMPQVQQARFSGQDRYLTAIDISRSTFPRATNVVLASGESFADALSASSLAGAFAAPILLTRGSFLPSAVSEEIRRLGATNVYVIGGGGAVSLGVERTLREMRLRVERIGGSDRYETAAMVAEKTLKARGTVLHREKVFVVRGDNFADALSVSPAAYAGRIPVLLVRPTEVPESTAAAIHNGGFSRAVVVGGTAAVSDSVRLKLGIASERVKGPDRYPDRYGTAAEFAAWASRSSLLRFADVGLATGQTFSDALSGGAAIGARGGVLLLTTSATLAPATRDALDARSGAIERLAVFGGQRAVEPGVVEQATSALR